MPAQYHGRHRSAQSRSVRRGTSLLASTALALGVLAVGSPRLGAANTPAPVNAPTASPRADGATGAGGTALRPVVSTAALGATIGGASVVSVAASTVSTMSKPAKAPASAAAKGKAPAKAKAPAAAKAPRAKAAPARGDADQAPERPVGLRGASLSGVAATPGGVAVPVGLAAARSLDWTQPVSGTRISSGYGPRWGRMHAGLDFAGPVGRPVSSVGLGIVTFAGHQGAYGKKVEVTLWDGTVVYYGHLDSIGVRVGDQVTSGQKLGTLGNTGRSTGPHLHFEVRPDGGAAIDPRPWLKERGVLP